MVKKDTTVPLNLHTGSFMFAGLLLLSGTKPINFQIADLQFAMLTRTTISFTELSYNAICNFET